MDEPEKPFACSLPGCGQTFTNEDHLHVHKKKHDMMLQFGLEQKAAFVADQTPTPTRFIRNCEEVGLFQDLQNVNPFDEGFKRAMETKAGIHSLEAIAADDTLHTPQMFPIDGDSALYTTTNNQRNITISRSSSDEAGAVKEYETTTISKLTNEVTTISRIVEKETTDKSEDNGLKNKDFVKGNSVSYTNNVIKIQSNVEIRKDTTDLIKNAPKAIVYTDSVIKDATSIVKKDVLLATDKLPPIMSQRSLDFVVDSLNDFNGNNNRRIDSKKAKNDIGNGTESTVRRQVSKSKDKINDATDFEVLITINGKKVKMKPVEEAIEAEKESHAKAIEAEKESHAKEKLKTVIESKIKKEKDARKGSAIIHSVPITGTLIPVNLISKPIIITNNVTKLPIPNLKNDFKVPSKKAKLRDKPGLERDGDINVVRDDKGVKRKDDKTDILSMRSAASKRYRERLKDKMHHQGVENRKLKDVNQKLMVENVALKKMVMEHLKTCPDAEGFRSNFAAHSFNP